MTGTMEQPRAADQSARPGGGRGTRRVVVGHDGSPDSLQALEWAAVEAGERRSRLSVLHAVHVGGGIARSAALLARYAREVGAELAEEGVRRAVEVDGAPDRDCIHPDIRLGSPASALVLASSEADLLVVGSRGRGSVAAVLLGSVAFGVSARASCPVVVVRGDAALRPGTRAPVVVGVDGSRAAEPAVVFAAEAAARSGAHLVVLAAWAAPGLAQAGYGGAREEEVLTSLRQDAHAVAATAASAARRLQPGLDIEERVVAGRAADALVASSAQAGLVVVGARGHGASTGLLLGSVSHATIHAACCPVAVAHPRGPLW